MNTQELFDFVVTKLSQQARRSVRLSEDHGGEVCVYRAPNGCKCAAGHCIADADYDPEMEETSVKTPLVWNAIVKNPELNLGHLPKISERVRIAESFGGEMLLLLNLQQIHDGEYVSEWPDRWRLLAKAMRLVYNGPETLVEGVPWGGATQS